MRLLKLWWIMAALKVAGWHGDRHGQIVGNCRRSLVRMGVTVDATHAR